MRHRQLIVFLLLTLTFAGLVLLAYWPALSGTYHFDDKVNLAGLEQINAGVDWRWFVLTGQNPPFGRALALLSFVPQAAFWPSQPSAFLLLNFLIHAVNVVLAGVFFFLLSRQMPGLRDRACWVAAFSALLWGLMPIHASASMMIVQRMTTLSASISLLGLIAYLLGRNGHFSTRVSWFLIAGAMPLCTVLAMAAKENAALLPFFCLLLEVALLQRNAPVLPGLKRATLIGMVLAAGAAVVFFVVLLPYWQAGYGGRAFTLSQRLLTESRIVMTYLRLIFLPRSTAFSPFNDDYAVSTGLDDPFTTLWSVVLLGGLAVSAVLVRRRWPIFSFAIFWFLLGHVLESTVVPLELYFDHRNYMPTLGLAFALVAGVFSAPAAYFRGLLFALLAYMGLTGFSLLETARIWGDPFLAASVWLDRHPQSERAVFFQAQQQAAHGNYRASFDTFAAGSDRQPFNGGLLVATVHTGCLAAVPAEELQLRLQKALTNLPNSSFSFTASASMPVLVGLVNDGRCPGMQLSDAMAMTDAMLQNPSYRNHASALVDIAFARGSILVSENRLSDAEREFADRLQQAPNLGNVLFLAKLKAAMGKQAEAQSLLDYWYDHPPVRQALVSYWQDEIRKGKAAVAEIKTGAGRSKLTK